MKVDLDKYLTPDQAGEIIGGNRRAVYRAIKRARAAGREVSVTILGKLLVQKSQIDVLRDFYYPYYSDAHQKMVKQWGAAGGRKAGITKRREKKARP